MKVYTWKHAIRNITEEAPVTEIRKYPWKKVNGVAVEIPEFKTKVVEMEVIEDEIVIDMEDVDELIEDVSEMVDEKDVLIEKLQAKGIKSSKQWRLETLEAKLAEAEKA